ncbi:MAG: hypothetical protein HY785_15070 [Oscillatoriophycideae cyanobacterium NC_groundwater_1537_Pr4_S-0.65um_50_18]|nr:hypothetical protein [Oscillatoriophycideae cyanobacterium NC_groundwater_1537_Pr4_S-0.65um_50_18]
MSSAYYPILSLGIRLLLVNRLQKALQIWQKEQLFLQSQQSKETACTIFASNPPLGEHLKFAFPSEIPLNRVKAHTQISYVSAIALKLAGQRSRTEEAMSIALGIREAWERMVAIESQKNTLAALDKIWQTTTVQVDSLGGIYLELTEQGLAEWLHILAHPQTYCNNLDQSTSIVAKNAPCIRDSTSKFHICYVHARCCSLLRSAVRDNLIDAHSYNFTLREQNLIRFNLRHPAEQHLVSQMVTVLDNLDNLASCNDVTVAQTPPALIWRSAQELSYSFEAFHKSCRIWGEVVQSDPQLAQMRLGLVLITQKILRSLLEEGLGIAAPVEL